MRSAPLLFTLILLATSLSGCLGGEPDEDEPCDEQQYWHQVSEASPYPGLGCEGGPIRTLAVTFFVYRDNDNASYISNETSLLAGLELINSVFNPHGINFALGEIINVNRAFPDVEDEQEGETGTVGNSSGGAGGDFGDGVPVSALGTEFEQHYNFSNVNIILITDGWGAYSMYPWHDRTYYATFVRASTFETSYIPSHELGHFTGLYHTHQYHEYTDSDSDLERASSWTDDWVVPNEQCYLTGDFVCGTPYDCYQWCEEDIGCDASDLYQGEKPGQEESEYPDCTLEQHSPSLENLMSRYGDRSVLTDDQGARARYFVQYMLDTERMGNQLVAVGDA
ncbi:MAG: hypothetical protein MK220_00720 [Candidatus Poseidoniia archaeon]|nr:hypothetical protein [Candidatus Poseidoniia archaeon]